MGCVRARVPKISLNLHLLPAFCKVTPWCFDLHLFGPGWQVQSLIKMEGLNPCPLPHEKSQRQALIKHVQETEKPWNHHKSHKDQPNQAKEQAHQSNLSWSIQGSPPPRLSALLSILLGLGSQPSAHLGRVSPTRMAQWKRHRAGSSDIGKGCVEIYTWNKYRNHMMRIDT